MAAVAAVSIVCKTPRPVASKTHLQSLLDLDDAASLAACFIRDVAAAVETVPQSSRPTGLRHLRSGKVGGRPAALLPTD